MSEIEETTTVEPTSVEDGAKPPVKVKKTEEQALAGFAEGIGWTSLALAIPTLVTGVIWVAGLIDDMNSNWDSGVTGAYVGAVVASTVGGALLLSVCGVICRYIALKMKPLT